MKTSLILVALFWSFVSNAKLLVISDIDDTIKSTHMLSSLVAFKNLFKKENAFMGFSNLYSLISLENENAVFAYVSNAPKGIMAHQHVEFLEANNFVGRENFSSRGLGEVFGDGKKGDSFKVRTIATLVENHNPDTLLLIGDNGERDVVAYEIITRRFSKIKVITYIHTAYSKERGKELGTGQKPYVTSLDFAIGLHLDGFLSREKLSAFFEQEAPAILSDVGEDDDGAQAFPKWMNCSIFSWRYNLGDDLGNLSAEIKSRLERECES